VRGYSQIVDVPAGNRLLFLAGQVALDSTGALVGRGDFPAQARQVFENLRRALAAEGATFADVVKLNYYVLDASQLTALREIRDRYVNTAAPPASTLVEVRRLFRDDVLLEVEAVAAVRPR
jgi:enamine deaminase RidA (YjgF/YER057c/UK114 family)